MTEQQAVQKAKEMWGPNADAQRRRLNGVLVYVVVGYPTNSRLDGEYAQGETWEDAFANATQTPTKQSHLLRPKVADVNRDVEHEQLSGSTDEELAARRAEIEAIGARHKVHGVNTYPQDLLRELQGIQSEQYARENGLKTKPHVRNVPPRDWGKQASQVLIPVEGTRASVDISKVSPDELDGEYLRFRGSRVLFAGEYEVKPSGEVFIKVKDEGSSPDRAYWAPANEVAFCDDVIPVLKKRWTVLAGAKQAAEESTEQPTSAPAVLDFVQRYSDQVSQSDKEVPETYRDLRPIDGPVDPGYFFVPGSLSGSRLQQSAVNIGNNRVFMKRYGDEEGVFPLRGDHGTFGVAIRISSISTPMLDDLKGLVEDYPSLDDAESSKAEHELIDEAWNDWAHYDFIRALENHLPDQEAQIDALDEDQARELFDTVRQRRGAEWTQDSTGVFIDVVPLAQTVTPEDLEAATPKVIKASVEDDDLEARRAEAKEFAEQLRQQDGIKRAPGVSFHNLLTKDQVLKVYDFAGMTLDKLPTKPGQVTLLPSPIENNVTIRITKSDKKSTYDKPLWLCEHVAGIKTN